MNLTEKVLDAWEADDDRWGGDPRSQAKIAVAVVLEEAAKVFDIFESVNKTGHDAKCAAAIRGMET